MNEGVIQNRIYYRCRELQHESISPNIFLYAWESDMISVTRAGYIHEYEIKISKSDFKADFKKEQKHAGLQNGHREPSEWEQRYVDRARDCETNGIPHHYLSKLTPDNKICVTRPNYFWYVCPKELIPVSAVPEYAGLIYLSENGWQLEKVKEAKKLHKNKISQHQGQKIINAFEWKYWNLRTRIMEKEQERAPAHQPPVGA